MLFLVSFIYNGQCLLYSHRLFRTFVAVFVFTHCLQPCVGVLENVYSHGFTKKVLDKSHILFILRSSTPGFKKY